MPNKHIISKYLGKVKIDEIFQHKNNDSLKGPDGINIRGNMYIDDNLGIGTEFVKNSKLNIVGNISISESTLNNGNILDITNISNNTIFSIQNNNIGINTKNPLSELHIVGSNGIIIPYGNTTDDRPTANTNHKGMIRFNTQLNSFEGCDGNNWNSLGGVIDVDQNTYISAENNASEDNNQLKFVTEGVERMIIGNTEQDGNVGIGINNPLSTLHIVGSDGIIIPYGNTTDDRPTANINHKGMIRFNTQLNSFEGCDGNNWNSLGGVIDVDQNTYVKAENNANEDNNQIKFVTENVQRMIIGNTEQDGNVGIGINNPLSTLHIGGSDGIIIPYGNTYDDRPTANTNHKGMIRFNTQLNSFEGCDGNYWNSLGGVIDVDQNTYISAENNASEDNNQLKFVTEGVERMIIGNTEQDGNVGIGINNPLSTLHIGGSDGIIIPYGNTYDDRPTANTNHKGMIRFNTQLNSFEGCDGNYWNSLGGVIDVDQNTYISAENNASEDNNQLKFVTEGVERMIIGNTSQSGNIGIGINNPLSTLHIVGSDGIIIPYGNTTDDRPTANTNHKGMIRFNTQLNSFEGCDGNNWGSLGGVIDVDQNTYISAENNASEDNNQLKFVTEGVERMIIGNTSQSGNIGIGTNDPLSTLHVNGNINCDYLYGDIIGTVSSIINHDTDDLIEGTTNLYYKNQRARDSISVIDQTGTNAVVYNNATGIITYSDPSLILDRLISIESQLVNINDKLTSLNEERVVNVENDMLEIANKINSLTGESTIDSIPIVINLDTHDGRISNVESLLISSTNTLYTLVGLDNISSIPQVMDPNLATGHITNIEKHIPTIQNIFKSLTTEYTNVENDMSTIQNIIKSLNEERVVNVENDMLEIANKINSLTGESTIDSIPIVINLDTHDGRISNVESLLISSTNTLYTLVGLDNISSIPQVMDPNLATGHITNIEKHIPTIQNIIKSLTEYTNVENDMSTIQNIIKSLNEERVVNVENDMLDVANKINSLIDESTIDSIPIVINLDTHDGRISNVESLLISSTNTLYTLVGLDNISSIPQVMDPNLDTGHITNVEKHISTIQNIIKSLTTKYN